VTPPPRLIALGWRVATVKKWNDGRLLYGPEFVGHPLEELFGELCDGINYAREWATWPGADPDFCLRQQSLLAQLAEETEAEYARIVAAREGA
jgi:hypothetical protein